MRLASIALVLTTATAALTAQVDRLELGLRLRHFERALAAQPDPARRDVAFVALDRGVQAFFRLDLAGVAEAVTDAELALGAREPTAGERFASSLQLVLPARLLTVGGRLPFSLRPCWPSTAEQPEQLSLQVQLDGTQQTRDLLVRELPNGGELPLGDTAAGEHVLRWRLRSGDKVLGERAAFVSVVADLVPRLDALDAAARTAGKDLEGRTLVALARMLLTMTRSRGEETVLPGARLLVEAEGLAQAVADDKPYYGSARTGQFWLRVPTPASTFAVRLLVPPPREAKQPLVLALHGAGGSENLFFDGYGDGESVRQCAQRGWYLCAPRAGLGVPDLPALVDALALRYPIDTQRVLLVGHSMGAAMVVAAASREPDRYAAVAALGGGGEARDSEALRRLPFFVATGSRDFLRASATALHQRLQQLEVPTEWREYAGVEHLAVVQIALPDVFAWFDRLLAR
jgi:predicted esterase